MNNFAGLFYPSVTQHQIDELKMAAIYFDELYVLSPISVVDINDNKDYYHELPRRLITDFGDDLGFEYVTQDMLRNDNILFTINLQEQLKPLIEEGVIHIVNPLDKMKSIGLEKEFNAIMKYRAQNAINETPNKWLSVDFGTSASIIIGPPEEHFLAATASSSYLQNLDIEMNLLRCKTHALTSIMFDSAALLSSKLDTIPITGMEFYDRNFSIQCTQGKYQASTFRMRAGMIFEIEDHASLRELESYEIMKQTMLKNLPPLNGISFDDICKLRRHYENELVAFRQEMRKLATKITHLYK